MQLPNPLPLHDLVSVVWYSVADSLGIIGNTTLLLAVLSRSPRSIRSYSVLIVNTIIIDLLANICSISTMTRAIPAGTALAFVYLGPCPMITKNTCHYMYAFLLHTFAQSIYLLALSFGYRLWVMQRPQPSTSRMIQLCILIYLPTLFMMIIFLFTLDPENEVRAVLKELRPEYDLSKYIVLGFASILTFSTMFTIMFMTMPITPILILILFLRARVIRILLEKSKMMSRRTHEMHRTLIKVLSLQLFLPILFLGAVLSYGSCQLDIYWSPTVEHLIIEIITIMPTIAPYISLFYVGPYRQFVLELFCRAPRQSSSSVSAVTSQTVDDRKADDLSTIV